MIDQDLLAKAKAGDPGAQFFIAGHYAEAQGVPQDYTKAAAWVLKAAGTKESLYHDRQLTGDRLRGQAGTPSDTSETYNINKSLKCLSNYGCQGEQSGRCGVGFARTRNACQRAPHADARFGSHSTFI